jgi:hypothetical protein
MGLLEVTHCYFVGLLVCSQFPTVSSLYSHVLHERSFSSEDYKLIQIHCNGMLL